MAVVLREPYQRGWRIKPNHTAPKFFMIFVTKALQELPRLDRHHIKLLGTAEISGDLENVKKDFAAIEYETFKSFNVKFIVKDGGPLLTLGVIPPEQRVFIEMHKSQPLLRRKFIELCLDCYPEVPIEQGAESHGAATEERADLEYDSMTGLLRRDVFDAEKDSIASRATSDQPLSCLMLDLDHFKSVNDTHGHSVGDEVIAAVGGILKSVLERRGEAYRYGGEEFVALLPNFTAEEATAVAERIRKKVAELAFSVPTLSITCSAGVAVLPTPGVTDERTLLKRADDALYQSKDTGRNKVTVAS